MRHPQWPDENQPTQPQVRTHRGALSLSTLARCIGGRLALWLQAGTNTPNLSARSRSFRKTVEPGTLTVNFGLLARPGAQLAFKRSSVPRGLLMPDRRLRLLHQALRSMIASDSRTHHGSPSASVEKPEPKSSTLSAKPDAAAGGSPSSTPTRT